MRFTQRSAACLLALGTSVGAPSRAAEADDARPIYELGKSAYDRGDYQEALVQFSRAYALRPAPALLFNMAQASRLSGTGHCAEALDLYERYLQRDPAPANRVEVNERITQMRACASDEEKPASARFPATDGAGSEPSHPSESKPPPSPSRAATSADPPPYVPLGPDAGKPASHHSPPLGAVLATGIGASLAVVGGVLYLRARAKYDEARGACPCPEGTYSDWETLSTVSYALMASGVVVAGTGAAFWILSGSDGAETKFSGAGLRFSGRF